jgi:hypothetical protein
VHGGHWQARGEAGPVAASVPVPVAVARAGPPALIGPGRLLVALSGLCGLTGRHWQLLLCTVLALTERAAHWQRISLHLTLRICTRRRTALLHMVLDVIDTVATKRWCIITLPRPGIVR